VAGISIAIVGAAGSLVAIGGAFFLFFAALPLVNTSADVLIRRNVETGRQGRVWGMIGFLTQSGYLVAYLTAAFLADRIFEPFMSGAGAGAGTSSSMSSSVSSSALATVLGAIIGTGPGRGTGLMIVIAGIALTGTAALALAFLPADGESCYIKETTL
jgi:hypothetical protein